MAKSSSASENLVPRKRGRPAKSAAPSLSIAESGNGATPITVRGPGRPKKSLKARSSLNIDASEDRRIEKMAQAAASSALEDLDFSEPDDENETEDDEDDPVVNEIQDSDRDFDDSPAPDILDRDVFNEAFRKAQLKNDMPCFYIYKNTEFAGVKQWPYSWAKLQQECGEGHYRVTAKSRKTGAILTRQTELVGSPIGSAMSSQASNLNENTFKPLAPEPGTAPTDPFAMLAYVNQFSEKAEAKAASASTAQASVMAATIQAMTTQQTQSQQMMMQMFQQQQQQFQTMMLQMQTNSQHQQESQMTLLTTLLSADKKGKSDGINPLELAKFGQDAEKRGEDRAMKFYEIADSKADQLAEDRMAMNESSRGDDKPESLTASLIKGLLPMATEVIKNPGILTQGQGMAAQGQAPQTPQPTAEQIQAYQLEMQRQQLAQQLQLQNQQEKLKARKVVAVQTQKQVQAKKVVQDEPETPAQLKVRVLEFIGRVGPKGPGVVDLIKNAISGGVPAPEAAEAVLKRLEETGLPRHTVGEHLTLEDVYKLALANGLPRMMLGLAEPWITEFYATILKLSVKPQAISDSNEVQSPPDRSQSPGSVQPNVATPEPVLTSDNSGSRGTTPDLGDGDSGESVRESTDN